MSNPKLAILYHYYQIIKYIILLCLLNNHTIKEAA